MAEDIALTVARHDERIENLEEYQKKQNGAIQRLADQYESLQKWLIAVLTTAVLNLGMMILNMLKGK